MPKITPLAAAHTDSTLALSEARDRWQRASEHLDYAAGTRHKYLQAINHFLAWVSNTWPEVTTVAHITPISLVSYRHALQHEQRLSSSTINLRLNALRTWCAWLDDEGYLTTNPAAHLHLVEQQRLSKREGLTPTQIDALLHLAQGSRHPARNYAIVQLLLQTGLRVDECAQLACDDIVFGERSGTVTVRAGKGNKTRTVPLNATARAALAAYMAPRLHSAPTIKTAAAAWSQEHGLLWHSQKKGRLSTAAIERMIAGLVQQAGSRVPQATSAHTLRHTFARNYLSQYPGDIVGLAALLGHSSLDTTRLYSEPTVSELATRVEHIHSNAYM